VPEVPDDPSDPDVPADPSDPELPEVPGDPPVDPDDPAPPELDIVASDASPLVGDPVTLRVTNANGEAPASASWTFGDGGQGDGVTTSHTWTGASATPYLVTVVATLPDGRQAVTSVNITVSDRPTVTLAVATPDGGSVTGQSITCPGTCQASFAPGTTIQLTANPDADHDFVGWGGACAGQGQTCGLTLDGNEAVSVDFRPKRVTLTVRANGGTGGGPDGAPSSVTWIGGGRGRCEAQRICTDTFAIGQTITITANDGQGNINVPVFREWDGACGSQGGNNPCRLTMDGDKEVVARYIILG
jgi:hypothetical protein